MIANSVHFEANYYYEVRVLDLAPTYALWLVGSGDLTLFFPSAEIRDAVRDALLKCPGCVARAEAEAAVDITELVGFVSEYGEPIRAPEPIGAQPAVQAMDAQEDWF